MPTAPGPEKGKTEKNFELAVMKEAADFPQAPNGKDRLSL
jgi:hypothetical protein